MLKLKHKIKVLEIKKHFINSHHRLLQIHCDDKDLFTLIEGAIILCDKVCKGSVSAKHFNDHTKLISLGLDSYVWLHLMRERNLIAEE